MKIAELPAATSAANNDLLEIETSAGASSRKITKANLLKDGVGTVEIKDGAVTPEKRSGGFYGTQWNASGLSAGPATITGIGFTPKAVIVLGNGNNATAGATTSTGYCFYNGSAYIQGAQATGATASTLRTTSLTTHTFLSVSQSAVAFGAIITGFSYGTISVNITAAINSDYAKFNILVLG